MPEFAADLYTRLAEPRLVKALGDASAILIHGPRRCGKTTLSRLLGTRPDYAHLSFGDAVARGAARSDPAGIVADLPAQVFAVGARPRIDRSWPQVRRTMQAGWCSRSARRRSADPVRVTV